MHLSAAERIRKQNERHEQPELKNMTCTGEGVPNKAMLGRQIGICLGTVQLEASTQARDSHDCFPTSDSRSV